MKKEKLTEIFSNCYLQDDEIIVDTGFKTILAVLKDEYHFDILKQIIAVDNQSEGIKLIYQLYSSADGENLFLSQNVTTETDTVTDIFKSAVADENEIYDLFGVNFLGNEELKRLYMPESWQGFPLRKDYVQDDTRLAWNDIDNTQT